MKVVEALRGMVQKSDKAVDLLGKTVEGMDNQSRLLNDKSGEVIAGLDNQSRVLNDKLEGLIKGTINQSSLLSDKLQELIGGTANQSGLLSDKLQELIGGTANQSGLLSDKLQELIGGTANQSGLLSDKLQELIGGTANQSGLLSDKLQELIEGMANQSGLLNAKFESLLKGTANQSTLLNDKLEELIEGTLNQSSLLNDKLMAIILRQDAQIQLQTAEIAAIRSIITERIDAFDTSTIQVPPVSDSHVVARKVRSSFESAMAQMPLMIDKKTYNTSHPQYDASLVRNFPTKILNADKSSDNIVYASLKKYAKGDEVPDKVWDSVLKDALEEAKTVPHADQVFERRTYIENYMKDLAKKYDAHYAAGWVNLDDALFLYWLVRKLNPKTILQTGVCNGLSSAFMMLALVKNSSGGTLHVIDMPPVFNPKSADWTIKNKVYGVVIPEGQTTGWMVPDAYRSRFEVWNGDAKELMPRMVDKLPSIDMFYHDSDHTYDHMMFEFGEAKRKLRPGGLVVGDDISWNASVWDFADQYGVPSYNFKGAVGVAFF